MSRMHCDVKVIMLMLIDVGIRVKRVRHDK